MKTNILKGLNSSGKRYFKRVKPNEKTFYNHVNKMSNMDFIEEVMDYTDYLTKKYGVKYSGKVVEEVNSAI
jgi:hypothetical protein